MSREMNISNQSSRASSGTIYTWERTSAQRANALLLLWRRSDGQEQSVSTSGTLRTGKKISSSRTRNISTSKSSITTRKTWFILKVPWGAFCGCRDATTLPTSWFVGSCPISGDTSSFLQERDETAVRVYQEDVLHGVVKQFNMTVFSGWNGSSSRTQFPPKSHDGSGVTAEEHSGLYQCRGLALGLSRPQPRDYKLWAVLKDMAFQKRHKNLDSLKSSSGIEPTTAGACRDSRVAGRSQGLRRGRGRSFWVALL